MATILQTTFSIAFIWRKFAYSDWDHDDVIKWKHFPYYWSFVRGIPRSPVNSPHKGPVTRRFDVSFICVWINGGVNNREADDLRRHRVHYDVTVLSSSKLRELGDKPLETKLIKIYGAIHNRQATVSEWLTCAPRRSIVLQLHQPRLWFITSGYLVKR